MNSLHTQTDVLLKALVDREVFTRSSLIQQWKTHPKCESHLSYTTTSNNCICLISDLLKAFSMWLPQSRHDDLAALWPPL